MCLQSWSYLFCISLSFLLKISSVPPLFLTCQCKKCTIQTIKTNQQSSDWRQPEGGMKLQKLKGQSRIVNYILWTKLKYPCLCESELLPIWSSASPKLPFNSFVVGNNVYEEGFKQGHAGRCSLLEGIYIVLWQYINPQRTHKSFHCSLFSEKSHSALQRCPPLQEHLRAHQ